MRGLKNTIVAVALLYAAGFPLAASAQMHGAEQPYGSPHEMPDTNANRPASRGAAAVAEDLRLKGKCDRAVPILRNIAEGDNAEISQFNLGLCLQDLAKAEHDSLKAADEMKEGADWILRAANAGFARAQAAAVNLYLDGSGVAADPIEAKKWALLYHSNPLRYSITLPDIDVGVSNRLDAAVTGPMRKEAKARAEAWTKTESKSDY